MTIKEQNDIELLQKELDEQKQTIEDYTNQLKRLQAEFDNYVKRVEKERQDVINRASERIILKLLTIVDDFERALPTIPKDARQGIDMIIKNIHKLLDEEHVATIPTNGTFDPYKHEVVLKADSDKPEDTIIEEIQKGYTMNGNVIRYAKVTVSKGNGGTQK